MVEQLNSLNPLVDILQQTTNCRDAGSSSCKKQLMHRRIRSEGIVTYETGSGAHAFGWKDNNGDVSSLSFTVSNRSRRYCFVEHVDGAYSVFYGYLRLS